MKFHLEIKGEHQALSDNPVIETIDILSQIEHKLADGTESGIIFDSNGNACGNWYIYTGQEKAEEFDEEE